MIIDPDFPDHWKTRTLVGLLDGDECAPIYVIRLWAHCQNRRKDTFESLTSEALKALCRFPGNANKLESSLVTSGFIRRSEGTLIVLNWAEYNSSLLAAWSNGARGGRPKKPTGSKVTDSKKPRGSREEKRREEKNTTTPTPSSNSTVPEVLSGLPAEWQVGEISNLLCLWSGHYAKATGKPHDAISMKALVYQFQQKGWSVEMACEALIYSLANPNWKQVSHPAEHQPAARESQYKPLTK